jgi:hypothetical protein
VIVHASVDRFGADIVICSISSAAFV